MVAKVEYQKFELHDYFAVVTDTCQENTFSKM